jgi:hypothetical protein
LAIRAACGSAPVEYASHRSERLSQSPDSTNRGTESAPELFGELDPEPALLMGPGPVDVYPRVLRAMSVPLQGSSIRSSPAT